MNLAIWIVAGAVLGLMSSLLGRRRRGPVVAVYVTAGTLGALVGGLIVSPLMGLALSHSASLSLPRLVVAMVTAALGLATVKFIRSRRRSWSVPKNSGF